MKTPEVRSSYPKSREEHKARAARRRKAMEMAARSKEHVEKIDFIPAEFVLQVHGWKAGFDVPFGEVKRWIVKHWNLRQLEKAYGGKWHWDLRIKKRGARTWFGFTLFTNPLRATREMAALGGGKGYESLIVAKHRGRPKMESQGENRWMTFEGKIPAGGPGAGHLKSPGYMVIIDKGACVLHRRELDFVDFSFLGKKLRGRFYNRLVRREGTLNFYFRPAKDQIKRSVLLGVLQGRIQLGPVDKSVLVERGFLE